MDGRQLRATDSIAALGAPLLGLIPSAGSSPSEKARFITNGHSRWLTVDRVAAWRAGARSSAQAPTTQRQLAFCLFGVAGVEHGKAELRQLSVKAVFAAADSHVRHVLEPIEQQGWSSVVFAHSWAGNGTKIALAVDMAYGNRMAASRHEMFGLYTSERVTSMLLSITTSLRLARNHAARLLHRPFDLVMLARHDVYFFRPLELGQIDSSTFMTAPWCVWQNGVQQGKPPGRCGELQLDPDVHGVLDLFFLGGQLILENVFGTMQIARMLRYQRTYTGTKATERLDSPVDITSQRHNAVAHYVIEAHLASLGLRARGLTSLHPTAVPYVHFGLYRERTIELGPIPNATLARGASAVCNGRRLCKVAVNPSQEAALQERWNHSVFLLEGHWTALHQQDQTLRKKGHDRGGAQGQDGRAVDSFAALATDDHPSAAQQPEPTPSARSSASDESKRQKKRTAVLASGSVKKAKMKPSPTQARGSADELSKCDQLPSSKSRKACVKELLCRSSNANVREQMKCR